MGLAISRTAPKAYPRQDLRTEARPGANPLKAQCVPPRKAGDRQVDSTLGAGSICELKSIGSVSVQIGPASERIIHLGQEDSVLETVGLTKKFGGLVAVDDLSFSLRDREILGIIGPNGAGKTTVFNLITGFTSVTSGHVVYKGQDITAHKPDKIARMGIARTFQNIRPFKTMTVLENVMVAAQLHHQPNLVGVLVSAPSFVRAETETKERALALLPFLDLEEFANVQAGSLTHGMQRRLEIARASLSSPIRSYWMNPQPG